MFIIMFLVGVLMMCGSVFVALAAPAISLGFLAGCLMPTGGVFVGIAVDEIKEYFTQKRRKNK